MPRKSLVLLAAIAITSPTFATGDLFDLPCFYSSAEPLHSDSADLDGDGFLDLLLVCESPNRYELRFGDGLGGFTGPAVRSLSEVPGDVVLKDVNGDSVLDILVLIPSQNRLTSFLGQGNGTFGSVSNTTIAPGSSPKGFAFGDVDQDGKVDALITAQSPGEVFIHSGNNDGTFASATSPITTGLIATGIDAADLDGDSLVDFVVSDDYTDRLYVHLGQGGGAFAAPVTYPTVDRPGDLHLVDVDQDSRIDVVSLSRAADHAAILFGVGDGTFEPAMQIATSAIATDVAIEDIDLDGVLDLGFLCTSPARCALLFGQGNRTFSSATTLIAPYYARTIDVLDLGGSADPEIVVAGSASSLIYLFPGAGAAANWPSPIATSDSPHGMELGDMNGDGHLDIVTAIDPGNLVAVIHGNSDGTFQPPIEFPTTSPSGFAEEVELADFNGDGLLDIAVSHRQYSISGSYPISIHLQLPGGGYATPLLEYAVDNPLDLSTADLNGDGFPDLVAPNRITNDVSVLLGNGDGTFLAMPRIALAGMSPAVCLGDMDGDGEVDLVVLVDGVKEAWILLGNGDGTFTQSWACPAYIEMDICEVGDVNMDGIPDVLAQHSGMDAIRYWLGNGDGTFSTFQTLNLADTGAGEIHVADITGDGVNDVIVNGVRGAQVRLGTGGGSFASSLEFATGYRSDHGTMGDIDGDGFVDMVFAAGDASGVGVRVNLSTGVHTVGDNFCGFSVNSSGGAASIRAFGVTSIAAEDLLLVGSNLPASQFGFFFFGAGQTQVPLANGWLCASSGGIGISRLPVRLTDSGGVLQYQVDFDHPAVTAKVTAGSRLNFQAWFRDPPAGGAASNLSNGLTIEFTP